MKLLQYVYYLKTELFPYFWEITSVHLVVHFMGSHMHSANLKIKYWCETKSFMLIKILKNQNFP